MSHTNGPDEGIPSVPIGWSPGTFDVLRFNESPQGYQHYLSAAKTITYPDPDIHHDGATETFETVRELLLSGRAPWMADEKSFRRYTAAVARNHTLSLVKRDSQRRRRDVRLLEALLNAPEDAFGYADAITKILTPDELQVLLRQSLRCLTVSERRLIRLRFIFGLRYRSIASLLGDHLNTNSRPLHRKTPGLRRQATKAEVAQVGNIFNHTIYPKLRGLLPPEVREFISPGHRIIYPQGDVTMAKQKPHRIGD